MEKDVLNSIKNDVQDEKKDMTISAVARRNFVSQALLVKLSKKMGFSGYRDLLFYLRQAQAEEDNTGSLLGTGEEAIRAVIRNYSDAVQKKFEYYLRQSRGTLISVFGIEESGLVADFIVRRIMEKQDGFLAYRGKPLENTSGQEESGMAIIVSDTGETETSMEMLFHARRLGLRTIAFTGNDRSRMAAEADLPIIIAEKNGDFQNFNLFVPFAMTAFILLFERLQR